MLFRIMLQKAGCVRVGQIWITMAPANGAAGLAASRNRLCTLLCGLMVSSERKTELLPHRNHGVSQLSDQSNVMRRGRGDPQSLGAPGNRRIIDRLDVDPVPVEQEIACLLAH